MKKIVRPVEICAQCNAEKKKRTLTALVRIEMMAALAMARLAVLETAAMSPRLRVLLLVARRGAVAGKRCAAVGIRARRRSVA